MTTQDGSETYVRGDGISYRSLHGAATESKYVFIEGTRLSTRAGPWRILELGFGTGMNFSHAVEAARRAEVELEYLSLEPDLMTPNLWLVAPKWKELKPDLNWTRGSTKVQIVTRKWQDFSPPKDHFHACFHDPFGPGAAPECWTQECFAWSHRALCDDGILATFGASSSARKAMKSAGFFVGSLPGAGGKREMTVASKSAQSIDFAKAWKRH